MLTIILPLPHPMLSPNKRPNRFQLSGLKKKARRDGYLAAQVAMADDGLQAPPLWTAVTVECHWYFETNRTRDADNLTASLEAAMDGISDAKVWVNDSVVRPLPPVYESVNARQPRVEIVVRPL